MVGKTSQPTAPSQITCQNSSRPATIYLPGAGGGAAFWRPVADRLWVNRPEHFFAWPGLGNEPHDPKVNSLDDLVALVLSELRERADLVAQSMGGLVAVKVALAAPDKVRRLVLTATSGGIPIADLGGADWRGAYRKEFPKAASWITEIQADLSSQISTILAPALLLWGDSDPISPIAAGQRLKALLPNAELYVVRGGNHDLAITHADEIAPIIASHLR